MNYDPQHAAVLGGGSWGTALAHIMASHGYKTFLWMRDKKVAKAINAQHENPRYLKGHPIHELVKATTDLKKATTHAQTIVVAIPSKVLRTVAREIGEYVTGDQILISATKGLEQESLKCMSEILLEETCALKVGALSGPNLAREVIEGQPSATVIASHFEEVIERCEQLLAGPSFRIYGNFDIIGVELAGALKNVVAIAAGVSTGLGFGANTLSMLITRGLAEISRLGERLGAEPLTFQGLAGIGDLIATCSSPLSRNQTVGRRLAQGESLQDIIDNLGMVAEGVNTTRGVFQYAQHIGLEMPIAEAMHQVLFDGVSANDALKNLMARRSVYELSHERIHESSFASRSIMEHAAAAAHRAAHGVKR